MTRGKRFFLYCQHLAGTGHFVRTYEIALALAERHEVFLVDGGRPIPRLSSAEGLTLIPLPRIYRDKYGMLPVESGRQIEEVMHQRRGALEQAIERIQPDVVMIEHFPFSKWELHDEVISFLRRARNVNPQVPVVCSLRDIAPGTRENSYREHRHLAVLQTLHAYFDLILVHADPRLLALEEHFPWASEIKLPLEYTGYVSQCIRDHFPERSEMFEHGVDQRRMAIVSAGGDGKSALIDCSIAAWKLLHSHTAVRDRTLAIFLPLFSRPKELALLKPHVNNDSIRLLPFRSDFLEWMRHADLSISQAGYNTCTNILRTNTRSILVPNERMADQLWRAKRFAERGIAMAIDPADLTPQRLAQAILERLDAPEPEHDINLDGANTTRQILERLAGDHSAAKETAENVPPIQAA